jgi:hypothetical protein
MWARDIPQIRGQLDDKLCCPARLAGLAAPLKKEQRLYP